FRLLISNTGVNLTRVREIVAHIHHPVIVHETQDNHSIFELRLHVEVPNEPIADFIPHINHPPDNVRSFHAEVRKRMSLTLNKPQHRMALLELQKPKEAIFLQKTMAMIDVHLADESFDANQLARSMAISRMQLHRRLKPLIQQSPAHFIRDIRLAKAKDMIEKEDLTLGEISYKTGFQSQSHFTRTFIKKYGVRPSAYRKGK
ncbi:MAG: helix-turn-helix transcriptional regulator, partial [Dyadobacter sp.]